MNDRQARACEYLRKLGRIEFLVKHDDGTWTVKLDNEKTYTVFRNGVCREVV